MTSTFKRVLAALFALFAIAAAPQAGAQTADFNTVLRLSTDAGYPVKTTPGDSRSFLVTLRGATREFQAGVFMLGNRVSVVAKLGSFPLDVPTLRKALELNFTSMTYASIQLDTAGTLLVARPVPVRGLDSEVLKEAFADVARAVDACAPLFDMRAASTKPQAQP